MCAEILAEKALMVSVLLDLILLQLSAETERSNIVLHFLPRQVMLVPSMSKQEKQCYKKQTQLVTALHEKIDPWIKSCCLRLTDVLILA